MARDPWTLGAPLAPLGPSAITIVHVSLQIVNVSLQIVNVSLQIVNESLTIGNESLTIVNVSFQTPLHFKLRSFSPTAIRNSSL